MLRNVGYASSESSMRPSRDYAGVGDLRPFGIEALLHYRCKRGSHGALDIMLISLRITEIGQRAVDRIAGNIATVLFDDF